MKYIGALLFAVVFFSCSGENENEVRIFNGIFFETMNGEIVGDIDEDIKIKYTEAFNNGEIQKPLYRYIRHENYDLFIGLPLSTTINEIVLSQLDANQSRFHSDSTYFYDYYTIDEQFVAEYIKKTPDNSLISIAAMTTNSEVADSLFNKVDLAGRLITKTDD